MPKSKNRKNHKQRKQRRINKLKSQADFMTAERKRKIEEMKQIIAKAKENEQNENAVGIQEEE